MLAFWDHPQGPSRALQVGTCRHASFAQMALSDQQAGGESEVESSGILLHLRGAEHHQIPLERFTFPWRCRCSTS